MKIEEWVLRNRDQNYLRVVPGKLGVNCLGKSRRLQRVLADFGAENSFGKAAEQVREHYGFEFSKTAVRKHTCSMLSERKHVWKPATKVGWRNCPPTGPIN